jgi:hypothetical protein
MKKVLDKMWYYFIGLPTCFIFGAVLFMKAKSGQLL